MPVQFAQKFTDIHDQYNISYDIHKRNASLPCFKKKKGTFRFGIRIFNNVQHSLRILKKEKAKFKVALIKYIHTPLIL
jgi:hypothetical protein